MKKLIQDVIEKFGGRLAGSEAEAQAQEWMQEQCRQYTDQVAHHQFEDRLTAQYGKLKLFTLVLIITLVLFWYQPWVALGLSFLNAFFFFFDFMGSSRYLDFLYPNMKSSNVTATLEPEGEVKTTLAFSGHMDSVREFIWWYYLKQVGMYLTVLAGITYIAAFFFYLAWAITSQIPSVGTSWTIYGWYVLVAMSPSTLTYFFMHGSTRVDGAQDNLSGIAVAFYVWNHFAKDGEKGKSTLKHTRLKFISFGSEECGLRGSRAYAQAHSEQLRQEKAHLVNLDGIRQVKELRVCHRENMSRTNYHPQLVEDVATAFDQAEVAHHRVALPIGRTDAAPFCWEKIPAMAIIGIDTNRLDPTYHTRLDTADNVEDAALEATQKALVQFVESWDETGKDLY